MALSQCWGSGSGYGSAPKCHGSPRLLQVKRSCSGRIRNTLSLRCARTCILRVPNTVPDSPPACSVGRSSLARTGRSRSCIGRAARSAGHTPGSGTARPTNLHGIEQLLLALAVERAARVTLPALALLPRPACRVQGIEHVSVLALAVERATRVTLPALALLPRPACRESNSSQLLNGLQ
jgi:hypothetical protein